MQLEEKKTAKSINIWSIRILMLLLSFPAQDLQSQSYGLNFSGHEVTLDQRTHLYLTPDKPLPYNSPIEFSFKLKFQPNSPSYFGYIFRMIFGDMNIDLMHGFLPGRTNNFQLVVNDPNKDISFAIPINRLTSEWLDFHFIIDIEEQKLICKVLDIDLEEELTGYSGKEGFRLFFGAHNYGHFSTTDVFSMNLKDVMISSPGKKKYHWPLDQIDGNIVEEKNHKAHGRAVNPNWLMKLHNQWNKIASLEIDGQIKIASDNSGGKLYIASSKSMKMLDIADQSFMSQDYSEPYNMLTTNQILFNSLHQELISYSIEQDYIHHYTAESKSWSGLPADSLATTDFWHHNKVLDGNGTLYTFGGYGRHLYKNFVNRWNPGLGSFDTVSFQGEFLPRYLAGGAYNTTDGHYYILGGYGSKSGLQTVNPDYYYELLKYSFEDSSFTRVYDCNDVEEEFCFAGSAVIDDSSDLYALKFSKYHFDNELQLVRINLDNPDIEELGSPIAYKFIDVDSQAELFLFSKLLKMIAVTSYIEDDVSTVDIYEIAYPPQEYLGKKNKVSASSNIFWILLGTGLILLFLGIISIHVYRRRKKSTNSSAEPSIAEAKPLPEKDAIYHSARVNRANSILLFGGFQVIDDDGNDITGSFTPLLKKLFLFIMLSSLKHNKGVSSNILYETFWFDKSVESARNNRAVNIVKLKSLIEKVGNTSISKDTGYWKFEISPGSVYIDYLDYLSITKKKESLTRESLDQLLLIINRGAFLRNLDADWLDEYKSEVSNEIIDTLAAYIHESDIEPEFVLQLTNCMFVFDIASEEAMILQCCTLVKLGKHSLAKKAYSKFIKEYKLLYNEEYDKPFNAILEEGKSNL
ncbi:hypothetical protein ACFLQX_01325 [Bacteroidota bacterium]